MSLRVFHPGPLTAGAQLTLGSDESHYLARVRRATPGDPVEVLDGVRLRARGHVTRGDPKASIVVIEEVLPPSPCVPLTLAIGMPARPAMLEALARACELGAQHVVLLRTDRSCPDPPKPDRIQKVLAAAQRQCGRPDRPQVHGPLPLAEWVPQWAGLGYLAAPTAGSAPPALDRGPVAVVLGPEGGLTIAEETRTTEAGFEPLSLGPFVLRTEIAVVAAASRIVPNLL